LQRRRSIPLTTRQYVQIATYRVTLTLLALIVAARAAHEYSAPQSAWPLASIFAASAAAFAIWPLIVPGRNKTLVSYSLASAFFLAGMFLLPPAGLMLTVCFAVTLAGVIRGARAYRIVFQVSSAVLAYVAPALLFNLGPRPGEFVLHPATRAGLELMIAMSAVVFHLLLRSIALRLEQGVSTPRWGVFSGPPLVEAVWGLVLSVTILVLTRIHPAFVGVVFVELGITSWFVRRYRIYVTDLKREAEAATSSVHETDDWESEEEEAPRWAVGKVRRIR
jgi:hypothetical protein